MEFRGIKVFGFILCSVLLLSVQTDGQRYYQSDDGRRYGARGENDCPLQCRCIALKKLGGYRDMSERWTSLGQMHGTGGMPWKGTDAPVWQEDPNTLQGRDVVCVGLNKVPRPLPADTAKLTLYGDSSAMLPDADQAKTQIRAKLISIREHSFMEGDDLHQLTISGNNIQILHPFIFRNVPNIQNLALQNNNIRHISAAAFTSLNNLKELRLSDNMIRYLSPNVFLQLTSLEYVYINGNKLSALHVVLFRKLKNLLYLDLSRNRFRGFSDSVFDGAVNLQDLLINENQINHIQARWFQNLSRLRNLEIRANALTRIDPSSFSTLTNLEQLSLSANVINTVSNEAFINLSRLRLLDIGTNDINNLEPNCFSGLDALDQLDLSVNRLHFINNKTFTATPTLHTLDLSKNIIKDIEQAALHPLSTLQKLDLSYNKLRKIESKTFSGLLELKEVNLEHNVISAVENDAFIVAPLNQLSKIAWLSLQYNRIKELGPYSLFGLPHLKFLNVGHNKLKTIHKKTFYTLISLRNLLLNKNRLSNIEPATFTNLKMLYSLSLESNKINSIKDNTFAGLKNLDDLSLVSNAIETISANAFRHFSKLKRLDLSNNLLSKFLFPDLILVKQLEHVDLSNNRLYDVEFSTQRTHEIINLVLTNNQLQSLSADITNVLSPSGNVWLSNNPWSCDCRLQWLVRYVSAYRLRMLGTRDTVCKAPSTLYGSKVKDVDARDFRCDNTTVSKTIVCQNLQIRYTAQASQIPSKGKQVARKWHVSIRDSTNVTSSCNGLLLNNNWVITRRQCFMNHFVDNGSSINIKVGRRHSRKPLLFVDYDTSADVADFDLRLIRLAPKKSSSKQQTTNPCILTHAQYHELSTAIPQAIFTARSYENKTKQWRLIARKGKLVNKCGNPGDICLKIRNKDSGVQMQGSPLSMRYQGIWYLAGLGVEGNVTSHQHVFTPLWSVTNWLSTVMHEVDSKCQFQVGQDGANINCEGLSVTGVTNPSKTKFVSV